MDKQIVVLAKYFFGEDAKIERKLFGGAWITTGLGDQVEFVSAEKGFRNYVGGPELYRSTLLMMRHISGNVVVKGSSDHIIACMAYGRELGIKVVPQGETTPGWKLTVGASGVSWIFLYPICGFIWDSLDGIWIAGLVASLIALLVYPYFKRVAERDAAREGQQYRDIFPEIHGPSDRQAPRESARQRGLL
jgi:hypothetical protein